MAPPSRSSITRWKRKQRNTFPAGLADGGGKQDKTGISESGNLDKLVALQNDQNIFKQGTPTAFLQIMTATVGVDSNKIVAATTNSENIQKAIENRRLSVMGVDEDEEAMDLIKFQNAYNLSSKMVSVMAEIYDRLILETGV